MKRSGAGPNTLVVSTPKQIASAENDVYLNVDGSTLIDMFGANGSVLLGHANERIARALTAQVAKVWNTGAVPVTVRTAGEAALESFLCQNYRCLGFYSTGMEASEFAIRVARHVTGRVGVAGFEGAMHGKSLATAYLGWNNRDGIELGDFVRLPGIGTKPEEQVLAALAGTLQKQTISAVFVEPIQATSGAHLASGWFHQQVQTLCRAHGSLLVFDEILSGLHRTGPRFMFETLGVEPDVLLLGKALGNGFPISAVVSRPSIERHPHMLPGSTFAGNPLAAAVSQEVLAMLVEHPPESAVAAIESAVAQHLGGIPGVTLRGKGALWVLELPTTIAAVDASAEIYRRGVLVGQAGPFIRLFPPITITKSNLRQACVTIHSCLALNQQTGALDGLVNQR